MIVKVRMIRVVQVSMVLILGALSMGVFAWAMQIRHGLEYSGINHPIAWGVYITNFVFWIGIGHAGTLISAVLLLFRQKWRMGINRSAEAMTIFAVFQAGLFPLIHMGRIWNGYWTMPIPNQLRDLTSFDLPVSFPSSDSVNLKNQNDQSQDAVILRDHLN